MPRKRKKLLDGSKDENVFDIMQGVSINLFVKTGKKKKDELGELLFSEIFGNREVKYRTLHTISLSEIKWNLLDSMNENLFFTIKNFEELSSFNRGFSITELFITYGMGITTGDDAQFVSFEKTDLIYKQQNQELIQTVNYRIFDERLLLYDPDKLERARTKLMSHLFENGNYSLISLRGVRNGLVSKFSIANKIVDKSFVSTLDNGYVFPLYLYSKNDTISSLLVDKEDIVSRTPNLNKDLVTKISVQLGLKFTSEKEFTDGTFAPIDILDYIYAVLHSPKYRSKYKEFLKIDFPRVPYPTDVEKFWKMVKLGGELRKVHLLESPVVTQYITRYPIEGDNEVEKITYREQKVFINKTQYFEGVPQIAWDFYIGGYQPAQKWLKDRKGRILNFEDIFHYQKIIVALTETDRLMKEVDEVFEG
jgi:predicted helicase